jgi:hypothetical protein
LFEGNYFRLLFDGAASISLSALLAALSRGYFSFHAVQETDSVMLLASIFLLPSTIIAFGVSSMIFAAYEFVQKRAQKKERERIEREMEALMGNGDSSGAISPEDIKRIIRPDRE